MTDEIDDFFDFAALGYSDCTLVSPQQRRQPCLLPDELANMDWARSDPPTICPADLVLSDACLSLASVPTSEHRGFALSPSLSACIHDSIGATPDVDPDDLVNISASQSDAITPVDDATIKCSDLAIAGHLTAKPPASSKRIGTQSRIPIEARQILEDEFANNPYPCSWEMDIIAHQANLDIKKVRNWYNNTRARKKVEDADFCDGFRELLTGEKRTLKPKLSKGSLEVCNMHSAYAFHSPQPPMAKCLTQSSHQEATRIPDVQLAINEHPLKGNYQDDTWISIGTGRRSSLVTSVASSEGTEPTTYTASSSGSHSNISSFGRERRRGRRRMAWKDSSHARNSINGVNNSGQPQKDLAFFCTFCPRAFKTKYEWVRHENSVHALRTTWICCDVKDTQLVICPFCGHARPDGAHMAGHRYQQCRSQPESQRTFYRRDHFTQHLHHVHFANIKHPSVRVGCQSRLMETEGSYFGCKNLALTWRRFGAPMKRDDPMMHCGFCGKRSKDWRERCEHVAEHLRARDLDRSAWWGDRKENHLENLYSAVPYESFRCRYCQKIFPDIQSMNEHSHCRVWSCRFLRSFGDVAADMPGPPLCSDTLSAWGNHCHLCGNGYRTLHIEHAQKYHRYRECNQEFYTSEEAFLQHLHNFHDASLPLLLQGSSVIEQSFMRNKGASFEPVEFNESWQPCLMDLASTPIGPFLVEPPTVPRSSKKDPTPTRRPQLIRTSPHEDPLYSPTPDNQQLVDIGPTPSKTEPLAPRFFRLTSLVPFLSSRIFYARNTKHTSPPRDPATVMEELPKPHITSLAMSAGVVTMAAAHWAIQPDTQLATGLTELTLHGLDE